MELNSTIPKFRKSREKIAHVFLQKDSEKSRLNK